MIAPIINQDVDELKNILKKKNEVFNIEFSNIHHLQVNMISLLNKEIFIKQKSISLVVRTGKLNKYLRKLGFSPKLESLIKEKFLNVDTLKIVLLGGSYGSSFKIMEIVKNTFFEKTAFIIVQHISISKIGAFDTILQEHTLNKVKYAQMDETIQAGYIYIAPKNKHLQCLEGRFLLSDEPKYNFSKPSLSLSYTSFSNYYKESLVLIQECGYGEDGLDTLELIKQNNSILLLQNPNECEAQSMIIKAKEKKTYSYILTVEEIILFLNIINKRLDKSSWVNFLVESIYIQYKQDFRLYHQDVIQRRLELFMIKNDIKNIANAVSIILFNSIAFQNFFLKVSITVTEFFRRPEFFMELENLLITNYKNNHHIKIWSAGCSSGEEPYSLSILLEHLNLLNKSIVYATDFNATVLKEAKNALYSFEALETATNNLKRIDSSIDINKYFISNNKYAMLDDKIQKKVNFFQHNLVSDATFNEFEMIICKNVIIYFEYNLQIKVFQLFYDSLKFGGILILGKSEMLTKEFEDKFELISSNCKIFKKVM